MILRIFVYLMRLLDYIFFPGFRKQSLQRPVYIIGNPRSGTTFTHRLIAKDPQFSYLKLYHTIFPSVTCYKLFKMTGKIDRIFGGPATKLLKLVSRKGFKGWETIHQTGPEKAESDEMFFVYAMLSPLLGLLFPYFKNLNEATFVDLIPQKERQKLMLYYKDCLQRHMYATGGDKILLQKVALIAGRLQSICSVLPDIRIVHLVRHPYESIPSLVSMFDAAWKTLTPHIRKNRQVNQELSDLICQYYLYLFEFKKKFPKNQFVEVRYEDLISNPYETTCFIYRSLDMQLSHEYEQILKEETLKAKQYNSKHHYSLRSFGLDKDEIYQKLKIIFEAYGFEP
jgi:hypothetical protein